MAPWNERVSGGRGCVRAGGQAPRRSRMQQCVEVGCSGGGQAVPPVAQGVHCAGGGNEECCGCCGAHRASRPAVRARMHWHSASPAGGQESSVVWCGKQQQGGGRQRRRSGAAAATARRCQGAHRAGCGAAIGHGITCLPSWRRWRPGRLAEQAGVLFSATAPPSRQSLPPGVFVTQP